MGGLKANFGRYALAGAILCALLAAWANWQFLKSGEQKEPVVVAVKEIQPFAPIPENAVELRMVRKGTAPADSARSLEAVKGQYSRALLLPDDTLRTAHLVSANGSNLAARLSQSKAYGKRAMALQVNAATGVAGTLREGDPVDILVAIQGATTKAGQASTLSKIIARRVPVLLVQTNKDSGIGSSSQTTVVLEVTPDKAEEIAFAQAQGQIWLLTAPYEAAGNEGPDTQGVNLETFLAKYRGTATATPEPAAAAAAPKR